MRRTEFRQYYLHERHRSTFPFNTMTYELVAGVRGLTRAQSGESLYHGITSITVTTHTIHDHEKLSLE